MAPKTQWFLAVLLATVVLDQVTKVWVYTSIAPHEQIQVIPGFFSIVHAQNPGGANGLFRDFAYRQYLFIGFAIVAAGVIVNMLRQLPPNPRVVPALLGLILGGAVGNAIDRLHKQTVTDFLRFYTENPTVGGWLKRWFGAAEYPSFNVADIALVLGVAIYLLHQLVSDDETAAAPPTPEQPGSPPG